MDVFIEDANVMYYPNAIQLEHVNIKIILGFITSMDDELQEAEAEGNGIEIIY